MLHLTILGGDIRQSYMLLHLINSLDKRHICYHILCYQMELLDTHIFQTYQKRLAKANSLEEAVQYCDILICPVPFTKDKKTMFSTMGSVDISELSYLLKQRKKKPVIVGGQIPGFFQKELPSAQYYDFMKEETFLKENSELTAEGLLKSIIEHTPFSLSHSNILILGFGKCGSVISKKLSALDAEIFVFDNQPAAIKQAEKLGFVFFDIAKTAPLPFDIVINTIPMPVLKAAFLRRLKRDCVLFDIASSPGGFDADMIQGLSLNVITCPSIPAKTAPSSAGTAICNYIERNVLL